MSYNKYFSYLGPNTDYLFSVRAVNEFGKSEASVLKVTTGKSSVFKLLLYVSYRGKDTCLYLLSDASSAAVRSCHPFKFLFIVRILALCYTSSFTFYCLFVSYFVIEAEEQKDLFREVKIRRV